MPSAFSLSQNYPNPFNAQTAIEYALPRAAAVKLEIFDILGQRVITLIDGPKPAGYHRATWDASGRSSGLYFYRIVADGESKSRRMTLIK
jgi:flagellar hook assembly protein FlgD